MVTLINADQVVESIPMGQFHYVYMVAIYLFFVSGGFVNYNFDFFLLNPET